MMNAITSDKMTNHDTWNDCPRCGRAWRDEIATPGIIHRTILCKVCIKKENKNGSKRK